VLRLVRDKRSSLFALFTSDEEKTVLLQEHLIVVTKILVLVVDLVAKLVEHRTLGC